MRNFENCLFLLTSKHYICKKGGAYSSEAPLVKLLALSENITLAKMACRGQILSYFASNEEKCCVLFTNGHF